jgi:hypothetical protein
VQWNLCSADLSDAYDRYRRPVTCGTTRACNISVNESLKRTAPPTFSNCSGIPPVPRITTVPEPHRRSRKSKIRFRRRRRRIVENDPTLGTR